MGQWAPGVQVADSTSKKGLGSDLGWFPFPAVTGRGRPTDGVGGGNGIAVGRTRRRRPSTSSILQQCHERSSLNSSTPPTALSPSSDESTVTDPNLQLVLKVGTRPPSSSSTRPGDLAGMGTAINEATVALFLGQSTPQKVCQAITDAAAAQ